MPLQRMAPGAVPAICAGQVDRWPLKRVLRECWSGSLLSLLQQVPPAPIVFVEGACSRSVKYVVKEKWGSANDREGFLVNLRFFSGILTFLSLNRSLKVVLTIISSRI
jgi:hypothetical protein